MRKPRTMGVSPLIRPLRGHPSGVALHPRGEKGGAYDPGSAGGAASAGLAGVGPAASEAA